MCQIVERVYTRSNGEVGYREDSYPCSKAPPGFYCDNLKRTRPNPPPLVSHDAGSSPISTAPSTPPTGATGGYAVRTRRPSDVGRRSSISEKKIRPEIIITLGSRKEKKYGSTKYKRSSLSGSIGSSHDYALESPGSDGSYTIRTGLPETSIDTIEHPNYNARPIVPSGQRNHVHSSSASSFTSSQTPSLVATSDLDTPTMRHTPRYPPTIVHQQNPPHSAASVPHPAPLTATRTTITSQSRYRTTTVVPGPSSSRDSIGAEAGSMIDPFMYQERSSSPPPLPFRPATATAGVQRGTYIERLAGHHADTDRRRQEAADLEMARRIQREEENNANIAKEPKQVHFAPDRYDVREQQREEARLKIKEKERKQKEKEKEKEEQDKERQKRAEILQRAKDKALAEDREQRREEQRQAETLRRQKEQDEWERQKREEKRRLKEEQEREKRNEETRRREKEAKRLEKEAKAAEQNKSRGRRDSRPPLSGTNARPNRRRSISRADREERDRLLAHENATMEGERVAALQREREENAANLIEQQQKPEYYDPRGGNRQVITNTEGPAVARRGSVSGKRPAITNGPPATSLGRRDSQRRASIVVQPAPPNAPAPINTSMPPPQPQPAQAPYSARPPLSATRANPPQFYTQPDAQPVYSPTRPTPSARVHSYSQAQDLNPFAQPPGRLSNTSQDNPYSQAPPARVSNTSQDNPNPFAPLPSRHSPNMPPRDTWDNREVSTTHARQPSDESQHTLRRRGEDYLARNTDGYDRARHATQSMHHAYQNGER